MGYLALVFSRFGLRLGKLGRKIFRGLFLLGYKSIQFFLLRVKVFLDLLEFGKFGIDVCRGCRLNGRARLNGRLRLLLRRSSVGFLLSLWQFNVDGSPFVLGERGDGGDAKNNDAANKKTRRV